MKKIETGRHGEMIAADFLRRKGLRIVEMNHYSRFGEIDIIARREGIYHFVEVKTRLGDGYGKASESVSGIKLSRFERSVRQYIKKKSIENDEISLDLIAVDIENDGTIEVEWIENITL